MPKPNCFCMFICDNNNNNNDKLKRIQSHWLIIIIIIIYIAGNSLMCMVEVHMQQQPFIESYNGPSRSYDNIQCGEFGDSSNKSYNKLQRQFINNHRIDITHWNI